MQKTTKFVFSTEKIKSAGCIKINARVIYIMFNLVPSFTYSEPDEKATDQLTPDDLRELSVWDRNIQPPSMLPGDFVEHDGVATIVVREDPTRVFDWYLRRREFIAARKRANAARRRTVEVQSTTRDWSCTRCGSRACVEQTNIAGKHHNPAGPAVVKYCRCGYKISKWYTLGVLTKCEVSP